MWAPSKLFQFAMFIAALQAIFYFQEVNASSEGSLDDTKSGYFLNPQWSELWGGIEPSQDDPRSNLKIVTRNKRKAWNFGSGNSDRAQYYKYRDGADDGDDDLLMSAF